jgi:hypothetical protein
MESKDWSVLMEALRILAPALGGWAVYLLRQVLANQTAALLRLTRIEDWQESHDEMDNQRFINVQRQIDKLK